MPTKTFQENSKVMCGLATVSLNYPQGQLLWYSTMWCIVSDYLPTALPQSFSILVRINSN